MQPKLAFLCEGFQDRWHRCIWPAHQRSSETNSNNTTFQPHWRLRFGSGVPFKSSRSPGWQGSEEMIIVLIERSPGGD